MQSDVVEVGAPAGGGGDFPEAGARGEERTRVFAEGGEVAVCEGAEEEDGEQDVGPVGEEGGEDGGERGCEEDGFEDAHGEGLDEVVGEGVARW